MRFTSPLLTAGVAVGAVALFAGYAASGSGTAPVRLPGHTTPARSHIGLPQWLKGSGVAPRFWRLVQLRNAIPRVRANALHRGLRRNGSKSAFDFDLAVSDFGTGAVEVLDQNYNLEESLTSGLNGPDGDWYDDVGNLYVANYSGVTVQQYAPETTVPSSTYSMGLGDPINATTDSFGNVYVTDYGFGGASVVVEYPWGSNAPLVSCSTGLANEGIAIDKSGNVFVSGNNPNTGVANIIEYSGGLAGCNGTPLGVTLGFAGGMQIDQNGNLAAIDQYAGVDIIPPPYTSVSGTCGSGFSDPFHDAFNADQSLLFVADVGNGNVQVLNYPSCSLVTTLGGGNNLVDPAGVALTVSYGPSPCDSPSAAEVGQCHTTVMQTLITHFAEIKAATGLTDPPPPDQAAEVFLHAALQVPDIDSQTKRLIREVASEYETYLSGNVGPYCQNALAQFNSGLQSAIGSKFNFNSVLNYLKSQLNQYPSCTDFKFGVQSAIQILKDGKTTIYNAKWYQSLGKPGSYAEQGYFDDQVVSHWQRPGRGALRLNKAPDPSPTPTRHPAKQVVIDTVGGDIAGGVAGAVTGAITGPGAGIVAAGGAAGTSAGVVTLTLWNWIWK